MILVIGVGNAYRGDDAAGLVAARRLRRLVPESVTILEHDGEPASLLDAWQGATRVYVIDAVRSRAAPGSVYRIEVGSDGGVALPGGAPQESSHALGVGDAVALGAALGRLPDHLTLIGVTGRSFGFGEALSEPVRRAVHRVAEELSEECERASACA
jgi:hydrogenase maturation protease